MASFFFVGKKGGKRERKKKRNYGPSFSFVFFFFFVCFVLFVCLVTIAVDVVFLFFFVFLDIMASTVVFRSLKTTHFFQFNEASKLKWMKLTTALHK